MPQKPNPNIQLVTVYLPRAHYEELRLRVYQRTAQSISAEIVRIVGGALAEDRQTLNDTPAELRGTGR